jgi:hypothetical protein
MTIRNLFLAALCAAASLHAEPTPGRVDRFAPQPVGT